MDAHLPPPGEVFTRAVEMPLPKAEPLQHPPDLSLERPPPPVVEPFDRLFVAFQKFRGGLLARLLEALLQPLDSPSLLLPTTLEPEVIQRDQVALERGKILGKVPDPEGPLPLDASFVEEGLAGQDPKEACLPGTVVAYKTDPRAFGNPPFQFFEDGPPPQTKGGVQEGDHGSLIFLAGSNDYTPWRLIFQGLLQRPFLLDFPQEIF